MLALISVAMTAGTLVVSNAEQAWAGTLVMTSCSGYGDPGTATDVNGAVWQSQGQANQFSLANACPAGGSFQITANGPSIPYGANGQWHTVTPPSIGITGAFTPLNEVLVAPGINTTIEGFGADYFWSGGSQTVADESSCCGGMDYGLGINRNDLNGSRYFGFQVSCINSAGCSAPNGGGQLLDVRGIQLTAVDSTPPSLLALGANNIWYQTGRWIRGAGWPASFQATADDGICAMQAVIDGRGIPGPSTPSRNTHSWTQCPTPQTQILTVDTTQYPDGPMSLVLSAGDAASPANVSSPSTTVQVDNTSVGLTLSGPAQVSSSAGTQYVTATATVGPSGLDAIRCSVDGGPPQAYTSSPASIPVSGLGQHSVQCTASNRSYNSAGQVAVSAPATFSMDIAQPTVSGVSFTNILHSLKCREVAERVKVPAKWVTVRRHGKRVKVRRRAHSKHARVMRCRMRVVKRRVTVVVKLKRHGRTVLVKRTKVKRIPVPPEAVTQSTKRVAFGKGTTVTGYLETANGIALSGRTVTVLSAPDNQLGQWSSAATVTTAANGAWSATLPAGPSRLVEAAYAGDSTTLPSTSTAATLLVPARIGITITPRRLPWSAAVRIRGHLSGGYVPPGGVALYLLINTSRHHRAYTPVSLRTNRKGTFAFQFSWKSGAGVATYPMRIALLGTASDYPFLAASSRAIKVSFGRPTPKAAKHHKKRRRRRQPRRR